MARGLRASGRGFVVDGRGVPVGPATTTTSLVWETATDWDNAASESGVAHEAVTNTDHGDATTLLQGYSYSSPLVSTNLLGYYPFHEDTGSTVNDVSGNNNDGTYNGPTLGQTGVLGSTAPTFDGTDDYVDLPALWGTPSYLEMSAWFKPSTTGQKTILSQVLSDGTDGSWNVVYDRGGSQQINIAIYGDNDYFGPAGGYATGTWHHIYAYYQPGTEIGAVINGVDEGSSSTTDSISASGEKVYVGDDQGDNFWDGEIAEVLCWGGSSKAVSTSQAQSLYNVVDTQGALTTGWKSASFAATTLTTTSTIGSNESIDVTVEQDVGSDGTVNNSQTVSIAGGTDETNSLSGFSSDSGRYRLVVNPDQTTVTTTPTFGRGEVSA